MITVTNEAKEKITSLLEGEEQKNLALRIAIKGRSGGSFQYDLGFVRESDRQDSDEVVNCGTFNIFVDQESAKDLKGATLDFAKGVFESGFKIENPNSVWSDPVAAAVQQVIDKKINPSIASHGGYVTLLDVKDDKAFISLGGGCQGCGMANVTLKQGIEVMIKEGVPQIKDVIDTTDHASGTNPYFQSSKGGSSPLA